MAERRVRSETDLSDLISVVRKQYPQIYSDVTSYVQSVHTQAGCVRLVNAFAALAIIGGNRYLRLLSNCASYVATEAGLDPINLAFGLDPLEPERLVNLANLDQISRIGRVGWIHGFFRMLTPASVVHLVQAGELCDTLVVGRESLTRSRRQKGEVIFSDEQINSMLLCPHLCEFVVQIDDEVAYTNSGYRDLMWRVKPDVYFGNASYPEAIRKEFEYRARMVGAMYQELPNVIGKSTTEFFALTRQG